MDQRAISAAKLSMENYRHITAHADSLMDLLAAQCADLEQLLALARRETTAAEKSDFAELMFVTRERATLGERMEVFQRQIAALKMQMTEPAVLVEVNETAYRTAALVNQIQALDATSMPLLLKARNAAADGLCRLNQGKKSVTAYLRTNADSVACDRHI